MALEILNYFELISAGLIVYVGQIWRLLQVHFSLYIQHGIETVLLIWALAKYKYFEKNNLTVIIYLLAGLLIIDIVVKNSSLKEFITIVHVFEILMFFFALTLYPSLKKERLAILIPIVSFALFIDIMEYLYASRGWYNLFMFNYYYIVIAPFYYVLFNTMLAFKGWKAKTYLSIACLSEMFFLYEYVAYDNTQINYLTTSIFYLQTVLLAGLVIAGLVTRQRPIILTAEPVFWICTGRLIYSLVEIVMSGMHPFLVRNYIELYNSKFMQTIEPDVGLLLALCYSYALFLCGKRWPQRISIPFIKQEARHLLKE